MYIAPAAVEFEWDRGNSGKNKKHGVEDSESEEVFFDEYKAALRAAVRSGGEERSILIGKTKKDRLLFVVFTLRGGKVRIISARDVNRKEAHLYEKEP
jgi:uncharacterized DUF497 family protein